MATHGVGARFAVVVLGVDDRICILQCRVDVVRALVQIKYTRALLSQFHSSRTEQE
jgi:hypothetical protein